MFSPETLAVLMGKLISNSNAVNAVKGDITSVKTSITNLETSVSQKWTKIPANVSSSIISKLETAYEGASTNTLFTGGYGSSNYSIGWCGFKGNGSRISYAIVFIEATDSAIGIAVRDTEGNWTITFIG